MATAEQPDTRLTAACGAFLEVVHQWNDGYDLRGIREAMTAAIEAFVGPASLPAVDVLTRDLEADFGNDLNPSFLEPLAAHVRKQMTPHAKAADYWMAEAKRFHAQLERAESRASLAQHDAVHYQELWRQLAAERRDAVGAEQGPASLEAHRIVIAALTRRIEALEAWKNEQSGCAGKEASHG